MYKETDSRKVSFGVIILFVVIAFITHTVLGFLPIPNVIKDIFFMAVMVAFVYILIKKYLTAYEYELTDDKIIITARIGNIERARAEAEYDAIECFCSCNDERLKQYDFKGQTLCTRKENNYALVFDTELNKTKIIFAPTEKFVSLLSDKMNQGGVTIDNNC